MVLVDTSAWVDHLRRGDPTVGQLLESGRVLAHSFVIGEIACGTLRARAEIMGLLGNLPRAPMASDEEVLYFIERQALMGRGLGYIDMHLLAAVAIDGASRLWTRDKRLGLAAAELGLAHAEASH
ncbi:MAG: type II toxin-antitoxin system VapC family toxin [Rhodocyclaceae bacterium]|nr:type II toxin-antitoxin system VapC family toxin [Rhodocyclaceae bacterium]